VHVTNLTRSIDHTLIDTIVVRLSGIWSSMQLEISKEMFRLANYSMLHAIIGCNCNVFLIESAGSGLTRYLSLALPGLLGFASECNSACRWLVGLAPMCV
jgi:hypothetical protein